MLQRDPSLGAQRGRGVGGDQTQAELDVAEHASLFGARDLSAVGVLARLAQIVHQGGAQQQIAIQPLVHRAELQRHLGDGHAVLEQAAQEGVVGDGAPGAGTGVGQRAGSAAQTVAQLAVGQQARQQGRQAGVIDLACELLDRSPSSSSRSRLETGRKLAASRSESSTLAIFRSEI